MSAYYKYVATNATDVSYALSESELKPIRDNDLALFKSKYPGPEGDLEKEHPIMECIPEEMTEDELQDDLDILELPENGVVESEQDRENIIEMIEQCLSIDEE